MRVDGEDGDEASCDNHLKARGSRARRRPSCFVQNTPRPSHPSPMESGDAIANGTLEGRGTRESTVEVDEERGESLAAIAFFDSVDQFDALEYANRPRKSESGEGGSRAGVGWRERARERVREGLESGHATMWMANITVWSLFGDDLRLMMTDADADIGFVIMVWICLVSFGVEVLLSVFAMDDYLGQFYFWLDLVATLSLLADIPAFMKAVGMDPCDGVDSYGTQFDQALSSGNTQGSRDVADAGFAKAGRASRAATKAGRIVRIIRLIRLVKIFKSFEITRQRKERRESLIKLKRDSLAKQNLLAEPEGQGTAANERDDDEHSLSHFEESKSRVGQKLSDLTTKRVIVGVLLMLFLLPVFSVDLYTVGEREEFMEGGLTMAHETFVNGVNGGEGSRGFYQSVNQYHAGTKGMYRLVVNGTDFSDDNNLAFILNDQAHKRLRCTEFAYTTYSSQLPDESSGFSFAFFDLQKESRVQALLNIMRTLFVCVILTVGAVLFSKDTNVLVLRPLDRMVSKIQAMSDNPLTQFDISDDEEDQMETRLLENSISRICSLLAVGFGDAGSEIIAENMKRGGAIDPMVPGRKMVAIFGFCDIRQFTDTTEVLQEDIMEFVNTIAKIVHLEVHVHGGRANKNIGDAFLLVWKFPHDIRDDDVTNFDDIDEVKRQRIRMVADNALASFVTIIGALRRSSRLHRYRRNKNLNNRINNFDVKMGFGLHVGWAIEGAIGSEHKVDASYLSPNVNISARLEAATKQFGVPLLFTGDFAALLSPAVQEEARQIDCVTVKGSLHPVELYTYDVNPENIPVPSVGTDPHRNFEDETLSVMEYSDEFKQHPDIVEMRKGVSRQFLDEFQRGLELYTNGEWLQARDVLQKTRTYLKAQGQVVDGPSDSLLTVMQKHNYNAPKSWKGFRELTEK